MNTAPALLACALGRPCRGPYACLFCGAPSESPFRLPDSFTAIDALTAPSSGHACSGCLVAVTATAGQSPEGKPWMWSWVLTAGRAERLAACAMLGGDRVRADRTRLREACLESPGPPSAVAIARAGRTHTLYRAAVYRGGPELVATLDGRAIRYSAGALVNRLSLCERIATAFGPKAARDALPIPPGRWTAESSDDLATWHDLLDDPLLALASCLFDDPPKEAQDA